MNQLGMEQTLVLIKPDALKNSLTGYVLSQLSEFHTGLRFAATKIVTVSPLLAGEHYAEHVNKAFYPSLLEYITGRVHYPDSPSNRRVIAIVYHGKEAVLKVRAIAGPTNPHTARDTKPGSIRALGTVVPIADESGQIVGDRMDNLIHASATPEEAEREVKLWFRPQDIPARMRLYPVEVNETPYFIEGDTLSTTYRAGLSSVIAPGDIAWSSDLDILREVTAGTAVPEAARLVAAKYLINRNDEEQA